VEGIGMSDTTAPTRKELDLIAVLDALSDPVRLQMVRIIDDADGATACVDMNLPISKSTGSHHFKVLREAGVVSCRIDGTRRYYSLRRDDLDARFPGLVDSVLNAAAADPRIARV
jgi:DNA-binding transcriptional ArsR family regulator